MIATDKLMVVAFQRAARSVYLAGLVSRMLKGSEVMLRCYDEGKNESWTRLEASVTDGAKVIVVPEPGERVGGDAESGEAENSGIVPWLRERGKDVLSLARDEAPSCEAIRKELASLLATQQPDPAMQTLMWTILNAESPIGSLLAKPHQLEKIECLEDWVGDVLDFGGGTESNIDKVLVAEATALRLSHALTPDDALMQWINRHTERRARTQALRYRALDQGGGVFSLQAQGDFNVSELRSFEHHRSFGSTLVRRGAKILVASLNNSRIVLISFIKPGTLPERWYELCGSGVFENSDERLASTIAAAKTLLESTASEA